MQGVKPSGGTLSADQNEQTVDLFDFLYRDNDRIASYYAQLFSGNLMGIRKDKSAAQKGTIDGELNVKVAKGGASMVNEISEGLAETIDPHDMRTIDVLSTLRKDVISDHKNAPHHSIVLLSGTLFLIDRYVLEIADIAVTSALDAEKKKPKKQQDRASMDTMNLMKKILPQMTLPSAFILAMDTGEQACGTIKDTGLEETIASYYFKYGSSGIPKVAVIGIKETPTSLIAGVPSAEFLTAARSAAEALSGLIFTSDAIRITPVAIFRKINRS